MIKYYVKVGLGYLIGGVRAHLTLDRKNATTYEEAEARKVAIGWGGRVVKVETTVKETYVAEEIK